jgi:hypothetical protein
MMCHYICHRTTRSKVLAHAQWLNVGSSFFGILFELRINFDSFLLISFNFLESNYRQIINGAHMNSMVSFIWHNIYLKVLSNLLLSSYACHLLFVKLAKKERTHELNSKFDNTYQIFFSLITI